MAPFFCEKSVSRLCLRLRQKWAVLDGLLKISRPKSLVFRGLRRKGR